MPIVSIVSLQEQYEFIYDTVAMYLMCGVTVVPARDLPSVVQKLSVKDQQSKINGFEKEYKVLILFALIFQILSFL